MAFKYFCHNCDTQITTNVEALTCPMCQSDFIEEVLEGEMHPAEAMGGSTESNQGSGQEVGQAPIIISGLTVPGMSAENPAA
jgi:hypothetical protein